MKHGKRPTKRQKIYIKGKGLNPDNWFVCRDTPEEMTIQHRISGKYKLLRKAAVTFA